jgi:hypothetical protein
LPLESFTGSLMLRGATDSNTERRALRHIQSSVNDTVVNDTRPDGLITHRLLARDGSSGTSLTVPLESRIRLDLEEVEVEGVVRAREALAGRITDDEEDSSARFAMVMRSLPLSYLSFSLAALTRALERKALVSVGSEFGSVDEDDCCE